MSTLMSLSFFFSSRRRHTRCALVTGVQTCALPILSSRMRSISRRSGAPDMRGPYQPNLGFETPDSSARQLFPCTAPLFPFDSRVLDLRGKLFWDHHILKKALTFASPLFPIEIGRASCRERVCQSVYISEDGET